MPSKTVPPEDVRQIISDRIPGQYMTLCPCHDDHDPSLSITIEDNGQLLTYCHACNAEHGAVMEAFVGEEWRSKKSKTFESLPEGTQYFYQDKQGKVIFAVVRQDLVDGKKITQWKRTPTGRWDPKGVSRIREKLPLYRLPEISNKKAVLVVEGEKCVHAVLDNNPNAAVTTASGGAQNEAKTDWNALAGKKCLLVSDSDQTGVDYMNRVAQILLALKCEVESYFNPSMDGTDIADWIREDGYDKTVQKVKDNVQSLEPRKPHFETGDVEEKDFSPEVAGLLIGQDMRNRVAFYKGDYWLAGQTSWERISHDDQFKAQVALEFRPRIVREIEDRNWKTKPAPDNPHFFTQNLLWGAFNSQVTRELNSEKNTIAVANGIVTLGLESPELETFDPTKHTNTISSPIQFETPDEKNVLRLDELQKTWLTKEGLKLFIQVISKTLFDGAFRQYLTIYAPPGSGKSTLVQLMHRTFGQLCYSVSAETMMMKSPTNEGLVDLIQQDPRFIFINESVSKLSAPLLNAMTGRDEIRARRLRKGEISGVLTGLPIIFRETPIEMEDPTEGTMDRGINIEFNQSIKNPDPDLLDRIREGKEDGLCLAFLYQIVHASRYTHTGA